MKKHLLLLCAFCVSLYGHSQKIYKLSSPDKNIGISISLSDKIDYDITYQNETLLEKGSLQMEIGNLQLGANPKLLKAISKSIQEELTPIVPLKYSTVSNNYNQLVLKFKGDYSVEFRAFNDGLAYRFITNKKGIVEVKNETFQVHFPENYLLHTQQPGSFKTAYEESYQHIQSKDWKETDKMALLPILIDTQKGYKILISESNLTDYPALFLKSNNNNGMYSVFPKVPVEFGEDGDRSLKILKEADYIAKTNGKRDFPWRYFVICKDDRQLIENTMTYKLADKNLLEDTSWIKPGLASWEWWNGATPYGPDVNFVAGCNLDTYKYFIDFASHYGVPYIIMDEGWAKTTRDPYTPNPTINLAELIQYGKERNVKIVLWLTWLAVENNFDLFKTFADWGIAGVKIDFMDRSDQWMVNYYERVAKEAAKHKLFVDFHGSFKPAGLERRYPNVLSYEGVLGMEQGGNCKPANSIYLPFMRNAVGPMDFTPGSMLSAQPEDNRSTRANAMGSGTRAYQMALFVVFESGLQMLADNPVYYYRERPCTEFISSVPVVWDETKVLDAKVGEYVVIARRSGKKWFLGAITNNMGRELEVDLSFLPENKKLHLTYFEDGINADRQAMDYKKKETEVTSSTKLTMKLVRNGGWAGVIE